MTHRKRCPLCGAVVRPLAERFWTKVEVCQPDECWPWKRHLSAAGYGKFRAAGKVQRAHRIAWELTYGAIPNGLVVMHKCDNRSCCNPAHMLLGTQLENIADRHAKGRDGSIPSPGETNPNAKLSLVQVREIRKDPRAQKVVASEHDISRSLVSMIRSGRRWGTLT